MQLSISHPEKTAQVKLQIHGIFSSVFLTGSSIFNESVMLIEWLGGRIDQCCSRQNSSEAGAEAGALAGCAVWRRFTVPVSQRACAPVPE